MRHIWVLQCKFCIVIASSPCFAKIVSRSLTLLLHFLLLRFCRYIHIHTYLTKAMCKNYAYRYVPICITFLNKSAKRWRWLEENTIKKHVLMASFIFWCKKCRLCLCLFLCFFFFTLYQIGSKILLKNLAMSFLYRIEK